jgi:type VI secretion system protein VasG
VIGQDHAMTMIAKRIQTSRAGLDIRQTIGVCLLAGTSERRAKPRTALRVAEVLYGGASRTVITINMSEYQEAHTGLNRSKARRRAYVGYGEGAS